jgi:DNA-binding NtrC family response regulator
MTNAEQRAARTVLVVEDDAAMRELLVESLADEGYRVVEASGGREGVRKVREQPVDLVITDIRMPDLDGLDMVREIRTLDAPPDVITVTAFGSIDTAIKAMKLGALDYITKPFDIEQLAIRVSRALGDRELRQEVTRLREEVAEKHRFDSLIGRSAAMQEVFELIRRLTDNPVSVLITGESGTGKELVARALHFNGRRADKPFAPVNCAAIPDNLLESELFGYKKGAFTDATHDRRGLLEEANGGSVFFDEVAELSPALQAKLLRVLQEREVKPLGSSQRIPVDVRVLSATNRDLDQLMRTGVFRHDLYYRLNVVTVHIPPLRERPDDILPLAGHLLRQAATRAEKEVDRIAPDAARALLAYDWPGNVRQLENVMERAVALCRGDRIEQTDLPAALLHRDPADVAAAAAEGLTLAQLEQSFIRHVLEQEQGNKSRAAQRLGLDRKTLYRKLKEQDDPTDPG